MDTIRVVYHHNDFMIMKMLVKPSKLNIAFTSLYSRDIWQVKKLIIGRCCMFPYNDDNVVFTRISWMIYITCPKVGDGVLSSL